MIEKSPWNFYIGSSIMVMAYIQFDINISQPATQLDFAKQIYFVIYNIAKIFLCNVSTRQALMIHICFIGVARPSVRLSVCGLNHVRSASSTMSIIKTSPETTLYYSQLCAKNTLFNNLPWDSNQFKYCFHKVLSKWPLRNVCHFIEHSIS